MYASKGVVDSRDEEEQSDGAQTSSSNGQFVTGDAKDLARKVANNPNIQFVNPATKTALEQFADTGQATNSCGQSFGIDPMLSGIMLGVSGKYKMYVNNFGFQSDRSFCDTGQHPAGKAIDLNGIEKIGGGGTGGGKTNWGV